MLISIVPAPFFAPPIFATTHLLSKWKGPVPDIFVHRGISSIINVFEDKERNCLGDNTLPFQTEVICDRRKLITTQTSSHISTRHSRTMHSTTGLSLKKRG